LPEEQPANAIVAINAAESRAERRVFSFIEDLSLE
jgi:hypothetical protein